MSGQVAQNHRQARDAKASGNVPLKNPRFEKLSREFAAGASQADAWRAAYGSEPSTGNPSRTFARLEIQARIEFLRNKFNETAGLSLSALQACLLRLADANPADLLEIVPSTRQGGSGPPQVAAKVRRGKGAPCDLDLETRDEVLAHFVKDHLNEKKTGLKNAIPDVTDEWNSNARASGVPEVSTATVEKAYKKRKRSK